MQGQAKQLPSIRLRGLATAVGVQPRRRAGTVGPGRAEGKQLVAGRWAEGASDAPPITHNMPARAWGLSTAATHAAGPAAQEGGRTRQLTEAQPAAGGCGGTQKSSGFPELLF